MHTHTLCNSSTTNYIGGGGVPRALHTARGYGRYIIYRSPYTYRCNTYLKLIFNTPLLPIPVNYCAHAIPGPCGSSQPDPAPPPPKRRLSLSAKSVHPRTRRRFPQATKGQRAQQKRRAARPSDVQRIRTPRRPPRAKTQKKAPELHTKDTKDQRTQQKRMATERLAMNRNPAQSTQRPESPTRQKRGATERRATDTNPAKATKGQRPQRKRRTTERH